MQYCLELTRHLPLLPRFPFLSSYYDSTNHLWRSSQRTQTFHSSRQQTKKSLGKKSVPVPPPARFAKTAHTITPSSKIFETETSFLYSTSTCAVHLAKESQNTSPLVFRTSALPNHVPNVKQSPKWCWILPSIGKPSAGL